jgi:hypothetical protein
MCFAAGISKEASVSAERIRVTGLLSRGSRGFVLSATDDGMWVIDAEGPMDHLVGENVIAEGTIVGFDRLKADWIGIASARGRPGEPA